MRRGRQRGGVPYGALRRGRTGAHGAGAGRGDEQQRAEGAGRPETGGRRARWARWAGGEGFAVRAGSRSVVPSHMRSLYVRTGTGGLVHGPRLLTTVPQERSNSPSPGEIIRKGGRGTAWER
ncbi:hypothetical protein GCM10023336_06550 [Streptomyces similanensis]|uniref:Uncharacterized protein n=1 Tax=Streptomyces similanensis TaxID=1274988 RepID=A0ABP9JXA3_9ACTN